MDSKRLKQIEEIYHAALGIAPGERDEFLQNHCVDDVELRREVESLLSFEKTSGNILDEPPKSMVAKVFGKEEMDLAGREISHYRIKKLLGKGGMGEVYLAEDKKLNREVALKILPPGLTESRDRLRRFELEARAVSALNHPNILTIHEFGEANDLHYIVMEFVRGTNLSEKIADGGLSINEALGIAGQVASALAQAHEAGIIHRDIKPENIMIRDDGYVKVLDFGLVKLIEGESRPSDSGSEDSTKFRTEIGTVMGTAAYMSPEQARAVQVGPRTDIWSLGVVLYEMLTGRKPFQGETRMDMIASVLSHEPLPVSSVGQNIPPELDRFVEKALSKNVKGRYQTAKELRSELEKIQKEIDFNETAKQTGHTNPDAGVTQEENGKSPVPSEFADQPPPVKRFYYPIIALVLLALISVVGYFVFVGFKENRRIDSIAVLPLENSSGNTDLNYVSDGLSEALIDRLSQLPQLKVIARNSSFSFRGTKADLREVAQSLGVRAIVMGNVAQVGDELAIRIDVVDATDNTHLTGGNFRRKIGDLLGIQNEIARLTAEKLQLKLNPSEAKRLAGNETENTAAYNFYLNGLVELNSLSGGRSRALENFEQAVKLDPNFAAAHTEIAWIYVVRANGSDNPREMMPKAKAAIERALEIDSEFAKAHAVKAMLHEYEFDWQSAETEYRRAIELSPSLNFARNNYAFFLSIMNRQTEALAELEQQSTRDPINRWLALLQKAIILVQARKFDDALQAYRDAQAADPLKEVPQFALGYAYAGKGLNNEAIDYYKKAIDELGGQEKYSQPLVYLAWTYAKIPEKRNEAQGILRRIETMKEYTSPALLAALHSALDDNDKAMELLKKAFRERDLLLRYVSVAYEYDGLRNDPRFKELLKRMNLPN